MSEPISIPGDIHERLDQTTFEATLAWLRSNGVNPNAVPADRPFVITGDVADYWVVVPGPDENPDAESPIGMSRRSYVLQDGEEWSSDDEYAKAVRPARTLITVPMPDELRAAIA